MRTRIEAPRPAPARPGIAHDYIDAIEHEKVLTYLMTALLAALVVVTWGMVVYGGLLIVTGRAW